ncbi:hypothetical protein EVG20_g2987 [Dentipellis fragilis]|uniref:Uncharacterized protein n=1 Tax=Dentipellis fragilis TaxID=205917 RepID=A0A4Y9Z7H8_9AGAM|nr:hypothetical protein EVG20_g2987 [Dentipellis fragilis]
MEKVMNPPHPEAIFEGSDMTGHILGLENTQRCLLQVLKSFSLPAFTSGTKEDGTPSFLVDAIAELATVLPSMESHHSARDTISNLRSLGQGTPSVLDGYLRRLEEYDILKQQVHSSTAEVADASHGLGQLTLPPALTL